MSKKLQLLFERAMEASKLVGPPEPPEFPKNTFATVSISSLEKSVRALAAKLEKWGLQTSVDVFRTGPGGAQHYGPSYVELHVAGKDKEGEEITEYAKFIAGGYVSMGSREFSGKWSYVSARALHLIMKTLARSGWQRP